jgi:predicted DCC family thiol-disulfide oxidoreductase YuxK
LYDGDCGFCHAWVRLLLALDGDGARFRFAPLQGETAHVLLTDAQRRAVGDTVVVRTPDGALLSRSAAAVYVLDRLGGAWRLASAMLSWVPLGLRDAAYDVIARVRHRLAPRPKGVCPLLPPHLRARFDA